MCRGEWATQELIDTVKSKVMDWGIAHSLPNSGCLDLPKVSVPERTGSTRERRTQQLPPHHKFVIGEWFGTGRRARALLGLTAITESSWAVIMRGDLSSPEHIDAIEEALREYGRRHQMKGWEEV
jgi:hypothetical protein